MDCENAIERSVQALNECFIPIGQLRYAQYMWEFGVGEELACNPLLNRHFHIPSEWGRFPFKKLRGRLLDGWLVVFNPADHPPTAPDDCPFVWVDETDGKARAYAPRKK